jgi:hypothetical protein
VLQPAVVALDPVVGVLLGAMPRRQQLLQDHQGRSAPDRHHLARHRPGRADGPLEESTGRPEIPRWRDEDVDDLPELIDRTVNLAPGAGDLHIGLIHLPAVTDNVAAGPGSLGQQGREPLHPRVDGDMVDLDTTLGERLLATSR